MPAWSAAVTAAPVASTTAVTAASLAALAANTVTTAVTTSSSTSCAGVASATHCSAARTAWRHCDTLLAQARVGRCFMRQICWIWQGT